MTFGLSLAAFTGLHVAISLIGIATGLFVLFPMFSGRILRGWTEIFLWSTLLTSITGFLFPFHGVTPAINLGVLSVLDLAVALFAFHVRNATGAWRRVYAVTAVVALYFNVFVLFAQLFAKVPALKAIAPTQASPAFGVTQLVVLAAFVFFGVKAFKGMRA